MVQYKGFVVLYTDGAASGINYFGEFCENASSEDSAEMFQIRMGETTDIADALGSAGWWLTPSF